MTKIFTFGPFLLAPERQLLLHRRQPVRIGCRALDLLIALVERPGQLVSKRVLMSCVWPSTTVEEGNLKANMMILRRALDLDPAAAGYIVTITGRGYRFVEPIEIAELSGDNESAVLAASRAARHASRLASMRIATEIPGRSQRAVTP